MRDNADRWYRGNLVEGNKGSLDLSFDHALLAFVSFVFCFLATYYSTITTMTVW